MTKLLKYTGFFLLFGLLCNGQLFAQSGVKVVSKLVSFGFAAVENRKIDVVVVHSTFNNSGGDFYDILIESNLDNDDDDLLEILSAHYVIGRDGVIYQLVNEKNVSYHAGKSQLPDGRTGLNTCSIGIELMTSFTEAPTEEQMKALAGLVNDIKLRYSIKFVLRHSDIAPGRKTDPWNMDWEEFLTRIN